MAVALDYARVLLALLPRGRALRRDEGSNLFKLLLALAHELARVDDSAWSLMDEFDPRTATEAGIARWEKALRLPDPYAPETVNLEERRAAVLAKLAQHLGARPADLVALAAALGYAVTIEEHRPTVCDEAECDVAECSWDSPTFWYDEAECDVAECAGPDIHAWFTVHIDAPGPAPLLEGAILRASQGHLQPLFEYEG